MSHPNMPSLAGQGMISIDVETCDPDLKKRGSGAHRGSFIAGVAIGTEAGFRGYFPIAHECGENLDKEKVLSWLKKELGTSTPKIGTNLLYDLGFLSVVGIKVHGPFYDIQVAEPLLCETRFKYDLGTLAQDYLGVGKFDAELDEFLVKSFGKKNPRSNIWRAPANIVAPYAIGDIDLPLRIFAKQRSELERQGLWDLFILESKLIPMLLAMRQRGVRVDLAKAEQMLAILSTKQVEIEGEIHRLSGVKVEIWAAKSIAKVFDSFGLDYPLTEKTKAPSFQAQFLEQHNHPVTDLIREARKLDKLCGTFLKGSILEGHTNGRIHCNFNQLKSDDGGAVSGRFSSSKPNLQFIPVRTAEGKMIRKMFLPDDDQDWYKLDYSQIEYRLVVHDAVHLGLRGAKAVADVYATDHDADFHQIVAHMVFGSKATKEDRQRAKTINFGILYGEGVAKLSRSLGLSKEDGEKLIKEYHRHAPFVKPLSDGVMRQAAQTGIVETLLHRKRRFDKWEIWTGGKNIIMPRRVPGSRRAFTYRALNARIQGSAADVMKKAMVDVWESGIREILGAPQLTIHDELDGSMPRTRTGREAVAEVKKIMEQTIELLVPLKVDAGIGSSWGECE